MLPQPEVAAKPIVVDTIDLLRYGRVMVTLRSPVANTEHFYFTVPKDNMQEVLDSLEVHDTRGKEPRVAFPAPRTRDVMPIVLRKNSVWQDLLELHQGAHVELHTRSGPVEGYFLGFQRHSQHDKLSIVLQAEGNVFIHEASSISAVGFKGAHVARELERYTSTRCRIHEEHAVYRITITASGTGDGEIFASYALSRPHRSAYDFSYIIHDKEDTDNDANNNVASNGHSTLQTMRAKCYAVIHNPLHYDLNDVHFTLHTGHYRVWQPAVDGQYGQVKEQARSRSSSPVSSAPSRSPSPQRGSTVRSPPSRASSKNASSKSQSDTESDTSEASSASSRSTTSLDAGHYYSSREWDVPDKICIKEGESVKVLLGEAQIEGGLVYLYGSQSTRCGVMLHNTVDRIFEPGPTMFVTKGLTVQLVLPFLKPGGYGLIEYDRASCVMEPTRSSQRGKVLSSRIIGKELVAKVTWYHKTRYSLLNKEDEERNFSIDHTSRKKAGREAQISAMFYPIASRTGDEEGEEGGEKLDEYCENTLPYVTYLVRVAPKRRSAIVVSETEVKLERYSILDCSKDAIVTLEQKKVVGPALVEKLKELADMRREMERLKRTGKLHRKRLERIKSYELELAQADISSEGTDGKEGNKRFFTSLSAAEGAMREIADALETIECETVKLKGEMKALKEGICEMKSVELSKDS